MCAARAARVNRLLSLSLGALAIVGCADDAAHADGGKLPDAATEGSGGAPGSGGASGSGNGGAGASGTGGSGGADAAPVGRDVSDAGLVDLTAFGCPPTYDGAAAYLMCIDSRPLGSNTMICGGLRVFVFGQDGWIACAYDRVGGLVGTESNGAIGLLPTGDPETPTTTHSTLGVPIPYKTCVRDPNVACPDGGGIRRGHLVDAGGD